MYVIIFNYNNIYHKLCGSITLDGYVNKDKTLLQGHIINYGGTARVISYDADDNKDIFSVECTECGVIIEYFDTKEKAIKKWNHRI